MGLSHIIFPAMVIIASCYPVMAQGEPETFISLQELRELIKQRIPDEETAQQSEDNYEEPLQLLMPSIGHDKLELNEIVLEKLANIEDPVAFVAVVGPYHW
jgi:hypothetical protein